MKAQRHCLKQVTEPKHAAKASAFTLVELMVASTLTVLILGAVVGFISFASKATSGITAQSVMNDHAGNANQFIQDRVRLATSISNDASGNTLTLGFDDNFLVDSNGDKKTYNDKDHFEQFQYIGAANAFTNVLVYLPRVGQSTKKVLIPFGVRKLLNGNVFFVTNGPIVIIKFGIVDGYSLNNYQSIDIQTTAVPLNRADTTNFIAILP